MTDEELGPRARVGTAEAVVTRRRLPSLVWLVPFVAALAGIFVAWRTLSERGPEITIRFRTATGLESGKTKVKYRDVEVGLLEDVVLEPDLSGVLCHVRMVKGADSYLKDGTRFWVERPRVEGAQVSGLGTLLSGAQIALDPVQEGKSERHFTGLEEPPIVKSDQPGHQYTLHSYRAGASSVGTGVYFHKIRVGEVVSTQLDPSGDFVTTKVFVDAPYDARVRTDTRFWNASGIDVSVGANGVEVETESLLSILAGGIAFDTPELETAASAAPAPDAVFELYESRAASERPVFHEKHVWLAYFDQSVRGLHVGAPVEFRGIQVGTVSDVRIEWDAATKRFRIPVLLQVEPERIGQLGSPDLETRRAALDALVAAGLRAQLQSGSLLTGELLVALDMHPDAPPARIAWNGPYPEFPSIPAPLDQIESSIAVLTKKLEKMPLDEIGASLRTSLDALHGTLESADRTLSSANGLIAPDSAVTVELRRALVELGDAARALGLAADQIERQPNSILFGKGGRK
jgi:paraquat-inducible protein B